MSNLSNRQIIFRNYLIQQLGFKDDAFLEKYLEELEIVAPKYNILGAQEKVWDKESKRYIPRVSEPYKNYNFDGDRFIPMEYNIIDFLRNEIAIKKAKKVKYKKTDSRYISASDIANFTFCPISYIICKSIDVTLFESAEIGTQLHNENRLVNFVNSRIAGSNTNEYADGFIKRNLDFFKLLKNSTPVFVGHSTEEQRYFKGEKNKYIGQPDYILKEKNKNVYFVIEEKFQFIPQDPRNYTGDYDHKKYNGIYNKRNNKKFYNNHVNQLTSYIYGINDYHISYGYLLYWKYEVRATEIIVVDCNILKVERNETVKKDIVNVFNNIENVLKNKSGKFEISSRNSTKCANCVCVHLCGHKTGQYDSYTFPYSSNFLNIKYVEFPEELKRTTVDNVVIPNREIYFDSEEIDDSQHP